MDFYITLFYEQYRLKTLHTLLPQQACVVLHKYTLPSLHSRVYGPNSCRISSKGIIIHNTSSPIARYPYLSPGWGDMHGQRNKPLITLS